MGPNEKRRRESITKRVSISKGRIISWAEEVLSLESEEIRLLKERLNQDFVRAVNLIFNCKGRIVISGMGKAGIIGQKFSATLSSTGTPSLWVHPAEAAHGDLGRITSKDIIIILSYSGHTEEIKRLLPVLKKIGSKIVAITGNFDSPLSRFAECILDVSVKREACPLGLAPTASTTAMLALCDALAICVQRLKGFKPEDFALFHPAGVLGKKLLLKVEDIMRKGRRNPLVGENASVKEVLIEITQARAGAASIVDKKGKLVGIFTDGDLRRNLEKYPDLLRRKVKEVMTRNPKRVDKDMLATEAARILETYKIDEVPVVDSKGIAVGILDIQDLLEAGVV